MRISSGTYKGRRIVVPRGVRPTESRVREALLDSWQTGLLGCRVLDLFAGSGGVGLEALSRGAELVVFAERSEPIARTLRQNCERLTAERVRVVIADLPGESSKLERWAPYGRIFADPPYDYTDYGNLLAAVAPLLAADGVLALEHSRRAETPEAPTGLTLLDRRTYGECGLSFYRR